MIKFSITYFLLTILLFAIEVCIALFIHDEFIRPYVGDTLVIILIYCFIQSFFRLPVLPAAISVLLFSFIVEALQYFKIIEILHLQHSNIARIVIGTSYAWQDLVAYVAGFIILLLFEYRKLSVVRSSLNQ